MSYALPRALVALALAVTVSGCSKSSSGEVGAVGTSGSPPAVDVHVSSMFMTLTNRAGQPLLDIKIAVNTGMMPYTTTIARMESGEKRDISLGSFAMRDGTAFNPRRSRPKDVTVTAVDLVGTKHEVSVPWK